MSSSPSSSQQTTARGSSNIFRDIFKPRRSIEEQLGGALETVLPVGTQITDLPNATWNRRRFVLEKQLHRKKTRSSWIQNHGMFLVELDSDGKELKAALWSCRRCDEAGNPELFGAKATSASISHLRKKHRILESSTFDTDDTNSSVLDLQLDAASKRPRLGRSSVPRSTVERIRDLNVGLTVDADLPFSTVSNQYLQQVFMTLDANLAAQVPWSRSTVRRDLDKIFTLKKVQIRQQLREAITKIHLSFDLWTSPNRFAMMAVHAHFIDNKGKQQNVLIALRRQLGSHDGENLAHTLEKVVRDWDIPDRVGTVISDNATNNDTCLKHLYPRLDSSMTPIDVQERRMRCFGHILNLVARAFLYGADADSFELQSLAFEMLQREEDDLQHWRRKGPVGKLHNVIRFIRASPQRSEAFKRIAHEVEEEEFYLHDESTAELEVIQNNETRWNSTYLMIERAFKKQDDIDNFIRQLERDPDRSKHVPTQDHLSIDDWRLLGEIKEILEPIYRLTMRCQGWGKGDGNGRLWEVMTGIEYLLEHLEDWKLLYNDDIEITAPILQQQVSARQQAAGAQSKAADVNPTRPITPPTPISRPTRARQRPARLDEFEVEYTPQARRPRALQQQEDDGFDEDALPQHTRVELAEFERPTARSVSDILALSGDYRAYVRTSINNAWVKANEYYDKLGESPLFSAAVILHPALNLTWLEANWAAPEQLQWLQGAKQGLQSYFDKWYPASALSASPSPIQPQQPRTQKEPDRFLQFIKSRSKQQRVDIGGELDRYFRLGQQEVEDPIQWWRDRQNLFPRLSQLALDIFAIPAMSADCERAFSQAKLVMTSQRLSMRPTTLEAVQCLKNWLRRSCITLGCYFGVQGSKEDEGRASVPI